MKQNNALPPPIEPDEELQITLLSSHEFKCATNAHYPKSAQHQKPPSLTYTP